MQKKVSIKSKFPNPPPFYKLYENLEESLPPPKPVVGKYTLYGDKYTSIFNKDIYPSLDKGGYKQLYETDINDSVVGGVKNKLKYFLDSLMKSFSDLLIFLTKSPTQANDKIIEINNLFMNFNHLLNTLREDNANQEILEKLKGVNKQQNKYIKEIDEYTGKVNFRYILELKQIFLELEK